MAPRAGGTQETLRRRPADAAAVRKGRIVVAGREGKAAVVGALILNRFRVRGQLGRGGFGVVYKAWDERLEREVAVKVIELGGQSVERVLREAQAVARLNHPSVVTLYELGEDGERAYLVSELVEGGTLAERQRAGELSDRDVGDAAADLCGALRHAHARGVVHRDIKPQNVLLADGERRAKLMDFGIARVLDGSAITAPGDVVGTLAYMAPEQAEGEESGPPSDVYSLALTLYEAWSGENPVARTTPAATARAIGEPLPPLDQLRGDLPLELCDTLDACLQPDPELRPPLEELEDSIEESLPELDGDGVVPRPRRRLPLAATVAALLGREPVHLAAAAAAAGLSGVVMAVTPSTSPALFYLLPVAAGLLTLLWSRIGFMLSAAAIAAWLAGPAARPGAALVVGLLALPPALLLRSGAALSLPLASPLLGLAGVAPVYPALAGMAGRARDRIVLGAAGYAWLAVAESALDRKLLFGPQQAAPSGWQQSVPETARHLLLPLLADPAFLFGITLWGLGALALGFVVRGRNPALDLLGALIWAAALIAALRLRAGAAAPAPGVLAVVVLAVVAAVIAWRARASAREQGQLLAPGPLQDAGREATLS
jgi:hypothetical protein